MKKILTISIGIPAHNEGENLATLIKSLLAQKNTFYTLKEIIVYTDGCTDQTSGVVTALSKKHPKVKLRHDGQRVGKPARLNQFFSEITSDVAITLDADVVLENKFGLDNLVKPFITNPDTVCVSGKAIPFTAHTPSAHIAMAMFRIWERTTLNSKERMYLSEGSVRSFSKNLYQKMRFPEDSSADDVYPYLYCSQHNLLWVHAPLAIVRFKLPSSFGDYLRVSSRYLQSGSIQSSHFPESLISSHFTITFIDRVRSLIVEFIKNPLATTAYILTMPIPRLMLLVDHKGRSATWDSARSTKTKRPHIVLSTYDDLKNPYYAGGGAFAVHEVAKRLTKDYEVTIVTSRHARSRHNEVIDNIKYRRIGYTPHFFPPMGQFIFVLLIPIAARFSKFSLWIESFTPPFSISLLPLCCKRPVVGLVHMLSAQEMTRKYHLPFTFIENLGLKLYRRFIVMSEVTAEKIMKTNHKASIAVIPNGVFLPKITKVTKKNQICFVGRLEFSQKGLDLLLESFSQIAMQSDWKLVIAGSGPHYEENRVIEMIEKNNIKERVTLLGRIDKHQRDILYKESAFIVIPSRYETFSLVALEALAYGLPILRFDIPGMNWLPEDCNISVKSFNTAVFAKQMLKLIKMPKTRSVMSKASLTNAKKYTWPNITAQYRYFINQSLPS